MKSAVNEEDVGFLNSKWGHDVAALAEIDDDKYESLVREMEEKFMADMNVCTFTGRLCKDAVIEQVGAKGTPIVKFDMANNTGFGNYARTNFFKIQLWGKQGEAIVNYLVKGKLVAVTGILENNQWTDRDGNKRDSWVLTANNVTLLGGGNSENRQPYHEETSEEFMY